jgi:PPP family 3-phenylpropionic acid transporter
VLAASFVCSLALPRRAEIPAGEGRRGVAALLSEPDFQLFLVVAFLGQCGQVAYDIGFSLHLADLGVTHPAIGAAWAIGVAAEVLLLASPVRAFRSQRVARWMAWALAGAAARWALIATIRSPALLFVLQPLHAISFGLVWLTQMAYASRRFPARSLATAQGLFATAIGLGSVVGMLLWGPVYSRAGGSIVFAGAAVFAVCASALAVALDRRVRIPVKGSSAAE